MMIASQGRGDRTCEATPWQCAFMLSQAHCGNTVLLNSTRRLSTSPDVSSASLMCCALCRALCFVLCFVLCRRWSSASGSCHGLSPSEPGLNLCQRLCQRGLWTGQAGHGVIRGTGRIRHRCEHMNGLAWLGLSPSTPVRGQAADGLWNRSHHLLFPSCTWLAQMQVNTPRCLSHTSCQQRGSAPYGFRGTSEVSLALTLPPPSAPLSLCPAPLPAVPPCAHPHYASSLLCPPPPPPMPPVFTSPAPHRPCLHLPLALLTPAPCPPPPQNCSPCCCSALDLQEQGPRQDQCHSQPGPHQPVGRGGGTATH